MRCVSVGYTENPVKDVGLRIRVQRELREQFLEACKAEDTPAAQVLREFMRSYVHQRRCAQQDRVEGQKQRSNYEAKQ